MSTRFTNRPVPCSCSLISDLAKLRDLLGLALLNGSGAVLSEPFLDRPTFGGKMFTKSRIVIFVEPAVALRLTFERRGTHDLPANLVPPPADWQVPFHALAEECGLPTDVAGVFAGVQKFVEEVLAQRTER